MEKILRRFKQAILVFVMAMLMIVLALAAVEFVFILIEQLTQPPRFLLDVTQLTTVFSFALMLLIGIELLESVEVAYMSEHNVRKLVEYIILIALIAIARKIIIIDFYTTDAIAILGIAAVFLSLPLGYYFLTKSRGSIDEN